MKSRENVFLWTEANVLPHFFVIRGDVLTVNTGRAVRRRIDSGQHVDRRRLNEGVSMKRRREKIVTFPAPL